jgi:hypothetical protein
LRLPCGFAREIGQDALLSTLGKRSGERRGRGRGGVACRGRVVQGEQESRRKGAGSVVREGRRATTSVGTVTESVATLRRMSDRHLKILLPLTEGAGGESKD